MSYHHCPDVGTFTGHLGTHLDFIYLLTCLSECTRGDHTQAHPHDSSCLTVIVHIWAHTYILYTCSHACSNADAKCLCVVVQVFPLGFLFCDHPDLVRVLPTFSFNHEIGNTFEVKHMPFIHGIEYVSAVSHVRRM
jgi:hypothetical protein